MFVIHPYLQVEESLAQSFLLEEYISHLRIQGLSLYTIESYNDFLVRFIRFSDFQDYHAFDSILKLKYAYYALTKRKIMNSSLLKYYKIIKKYSEFLKDNELIEKVHINQIPRVRVSASLPKSLGEKEVGEIRKCVMTVKAQSPFLQMRNTMIIETFLYT